MRIFLFHVPKGGVHIHTLAQAKLCLEYGLPILVNYFFSVSGLWGWSESCREGFPQTSDLRVRRNRYGGQYTVVISISFQKEGH